MQLVQLLGDLVVWCGPLALVLVGMVHGPRPGGAEDGTDAELVAAVLRGDATAYRGLVERYQNRVYTLVYGVVRDHEEAKDITQDALVKAFRSLSSCREPSRFRSWLLTMAMNLAIDANRRRVHRPEPGPVDDMAVGAANGEYDGFTHEDTPARRYEMGQMHKDLLKVLDSLPEDQKQVVLLRELEGLSYKEIAEITNTADGTVMSRLYYARKRLQEVMNRYEG